MKNRLNFILVTFMVLLTALPSQAQNWSKLSKDEAESIKRLSTKMCTQLQMSKTAKHEDAGRQVEKHILNQLNITREDPNYKLKAANFWNKYAEYFVCTNNGGRRKPQHFLKRVVDMDFTNKVLYDFLLYDEEEYPISVNAIEIYKGKEETFLDYLNAILADPKNEEFYSFKEIKLLKSIIIEDYGAKTASELKN